MLCGILFERAARRTAWLMLAIAALGVCCPIRAQELSALVGAQYTQSLNEKTYSFSYEYLQNINEHFFATFTWLNEGHVTDHHRDGQSVQFWARWLSDSRRFTLSAGLGPYRYYDTTTGGAVDGDTTDEHGFGVMYSAGARWYIRHPLVLELRYNHIQFADSIGTDTLLVGVGYEFDPGTRPGPGVPAATYGWSSDARNDLTFMAGKTVVNSFHSQEGAGWGFEYRRRLTPFIDFTATFLDEGHEGAVNRRGVAVSAWLAREFLDHRAAVGLGLGPYFAHDPEATGKQTQALGLLTIGAWWRWSDAWATRAYWYRTVTPDGRDTDVVMLGLTYGF